MSCHNSHILALDADFDHKKFILINFHNRSSEVKQLKTLFEPSRMLVKLQLTQNSLIVFSGDFNLFFNINLEIQDL